MISFCPVFSFCCFFSPALAKFETNWVQIFLCSTDFIEQFLLSDIKIRLFFATQGQKFKIIFNILPWSTTFLSIPKNRYVESLNQCYIDTRKFEEPITKISPSTQICYANSRISFLAEPKLAHPEYRSQHISICSVRKSALGANCKKRIEELSKPIFRENIHIKQNAHVVTNAAKLAKCSVRVQQLAKPKIRRN